MKIQNSKFEKQEKTKCNFIILWSAKSIVLLALLFLAVSAKATLTVTQTSEAISTATATPFILATATNTSIFIPVETLTPTNTSTKPVQPTYTFSPTCVAQPSATQVVSLFVEFASSNILNPSLDKHADGVAFKINLTKDAGLSVKVYSRYGALVYVLREDNSTTPAGTHFISWNGRDKFNKAVASGVYIVLFKTPFVIDRKTVIVRK